MEQTPDIVQSIKNDMAVLGGVPKTLDVLESIISAYNNPVPRKAIPQVSISTVSTALSKARFHFIESEDDFV